MDHTNEMQLIFDSRSSNESFARVTVAAFMTSLNPTVEEVSDVKTAVSEAVTNAIIHGYEGEVHNICIRCRTKEQTLFVEIEDFGKGIGTTFYNKSGSGTIRHGIFLYGSIYG